MKRNEVKFDNMSPDQSIGAFDKSGQWVEICTVRDLREFEASLSKGADPVAYGVFNKYGDLLYLSASKEAADLIKKWEGDSIKPLYEEPVKIESAVAGWKPPQACDGKEQLAFEAWAVSQRYDMHEHPLHYIFMDPKTSAARMGWNAALKYVRDQFAASPTSSQGDAE